MISFDFRTNSLLTKEKIFSNTVGLKLNFSSTPPLLTGHISSRIFLLFLECASIRCEKKIHESISILSHTMRECCEKSHYALVTKSDGNDRRFLKNLIPTKRQTSHFNTIVLCRILQVRNPTYIQDSSPKPCDVW